MSHKKMILLLVELDMFLKELREDMVFVEFGDELTLFKKQRDERVSEGYMWFSDTATDQIYKLRQKIEAVLDENK